MDPGDIISYLDMCRNEGVNLQRGMNYRLNPNYSVILMSVRVGAPYEDKIEDDGKVLIYEGHDTAKRSREINPKAIDQPMHNQSGTFTQNGLFFNAVKEFKDGKRSEEPIKVYEKIRSGIWVYNGLFELIDAWLENDGKRNVFKFKLSLSEKSISKRSVTPIIDHSRLIPTSVKLEVWKRDKGRCVQCGSKENLHFDHIIPYSKGGTSLIAENIQLLCARHNLEKRDKIK